MDESRSKNPCPNLRCRLASNQRDAGIAKSSRNQTILGWYERVIVAYKTAFHTRAMKALIVITIVSVAAWAQTRPTYTTGYGSTITNADAEPAPYVPISSGVMVPGPQHLPLAERRAESAPGPTLGETEDVKEFWEPILVNQALPAPQPPVFYPVYPVGIHIGHPHHAAPVGHLTGHTGHRR